MDPWKNQPLVWSHTTIHQGLGGFILITILVLTTKDCTVSSDSSAVEIKIKAVVVRGERERERHPVSLQMF